MKQFIVILLGCLIILPASAQSIKGGQFYIDPGFTSLGFNSTNVSIDGAEDPTNSTRLGFSLGAGIGIFKNFAIEAGFAVQNLTDTEDDVALKLSGAYAGVRFYLLKGLFVSGAAMTATGKLDDGTGTTAEYGNELDALLFKGKVGYDIFFKKHFAIEPNVSYLRSISASIADTDIDFDNLSLNISFLYKF